MATEITMPRLSDTMSEGTIAKWRKQVGEKVDKGDILVEIETDKATMELEAFQAGVLGLITVGEGETVPIGESIGLMVAPGEEVPAAAPAAPATAPASAGPAPASEAAATAVAAAPPVVPDSPEGPEGDGRIRVSPLARRIASEQGADLRQIAGTGQGGRITRDDVEAYLTHPAAASAAPMPAAKMAFPALEESEGEELANLSSMQRTVVQRMLESKAAAPHFYVTSEIDMTEAVNLRRSLNEALGEGRGVSFNDMIVKAAARALRAVPQVNRSYRDGKMVSYRHVHVGVAVAIPDGLVVPVVRHADHKSVAQIAADTNEIIERARNRKLSPQDMEGSTFSITNLGMYDVDQFTGIINQPNAAILAVGSIVKKPVVKNDQIAVSDRMRVTMSCDHRAVYGADAASFLKELKRILEHPLLLLL